MNRTGFLAASGALAAAGTAAQALAQSIPGGSHLVERKADFDAAAFKKAVAGSSRIRQVFEQIAFKPGVFSNMKNAMNGLQFGFGYKPGDFIVAFGGHGPSAAYGYSQAIWDKYKLGDYYPLKDGQGNTISTNSYVTAKAKYDPSADPDDPAGMYQDTSIEMLQKRGLVVLTCHTAVEEQARGIVKAGNAPSGMTPTDVANDILTHLIPGAIVVPSMVATMAVLQHEHQYTYAALTF
jgi:hypothetical protein